MKPTEISARIIRRLPRVTQRLIGALGWDDTFKFLRIQGLRCVYFPQLFSHEHNLFAGLSEEKARALHAEFKGTDVELPSCRRMLCSERHQMIFEDVHDRDFTHKMLIEKYKMPRQTIDWVIETFEAAPIVRGKK